MDGGAYAEGQGLSGGQWQSVAFARTCMRPTPQLLVLDEPGHSLDALAEQQMCDAFSRIARDIAVQVAGVTIFVSHRLSTVRLADLIVVMDQGRIIEQGTHADLMARQGTYAELFSMQARAYT